MQSFQDIKDLLLKSLSNTCSQTLMDLWFNHLKIGALSDTNVVLVSDSDIKAEIINKRYTPTLEQCFEDILGFRVQVVVISEESKPLDYERLQNDVMQGIIPPPPVPFEGTAEIPAAPKTEKEKAPAAAVPEEAPAPKAQERDTVPPPFRNDEYTFDNFIVGSSNKFAHAACVAVANNPAHAYNPLFIYGPSGLGKTHLLYAITNSIREQNPKATIVYVKGETFTNELVEAISNGSTVAFREKYRQVDVFLLDDVQFIAGKDYTQEEFFNTFNELYEAKKQIILTSDRPPKEMKTLEDRLKTRFEWGLIVDIQPPDLELRLAILRKKSESMEVEIPMDVLNYLAEKLKSNIRQIEGAIKRLSAYSSLTKQPVTMEMAKENIQDFVTGSEPVRITQDKILAAVAKKYGVEQADILGRHKKQEIAQARHVCIYILRTLTDMSLPSIGKIFGRDHTTVLHSYETIAQKRREDASVENMIDDLIKEIREQS